MLNLGEHALGRKWRGKDIPFSGEEIRWTVYFEIRYLTVCK